MACDDTSLEAVVTLNHLDEMYLVLNTEIKEKP